MTLVVAIVLALWSASGGTAALITGIHVAREREEPAGFVAKKGKALLLTLAAIVFLVIVIFLVAAVPPLLDEAGLGDAGRLAVRHPAMAGPGGRDAPRHRAALPLLRGPASPRAGWAW